MLPVSKTDHTGWYGYTLSFDHVLNFTVSFLQSKSQTKSRIKSPQSSLPP